MFQQFIQDLWIPLFIVLILIGIFAGQGLIIGFGAMGLLVAGVSWLWNRVSLEDVSYERQLSQQRVFIGEEVNITISVTNKKPVPLAMLNIEDELPHEITIVDADISVSPNPNAVILRHSTSVAWYERIRWQYRMTASRRGFYRLGPVRMESGDLFGLFSNSKTETSHDYLLVYPRVYPLPELRFPAARPLGEVRGGIRIYEDAARPSGLRDYQVGDPLKIVDWKSSARMQRLQVRTYEPSSNMTVILVVVVETAARYWEGYSPAGLERLITAAASVASYAAERQYSLGLFSNGTPVLADRPMKIAPNSSPEQLTIILEALATIRPIAMGLMAGQLAEQVRRFPLGATLVIVAALISEHLVDAIISLRNSGHGVVVIYVGDDPCPEFPQSIIVHNLRDYFDSMERDGG
ncbi:MAG: DUF58 domain-containing protein [Chloroflexi bacterium]|nr:DUF58 domain-containing protein [Chloroflexota bacterium]